MCSSGSKLADLTYECCELFLAVVFAEGGHHSFALTDGLL